LLTVSTVEDGCGFTYVIFRAVSVFLAVGATKLATTRILDTGVHGFGARAIGMTVAGKAEVREVGDADENDI